MRTYVTLFFLLYFSRLVYASIGDRSLAFQSCLTSCIDDGQGCSRFPLALRWSRWTCRDNCSYTCMHKLTDAGISSTPSLQEKVLALPGLPPNRVVQFYGKWPFYRFLGVQEPLSVLFSLSNLYMHARYGLSLRQRLPKDFPEPLARAYSMLPYAGINLWIWSIVFHTRDKSLTEKLDYFSAAFSMMCNLYVAIVRLGNLYPPFGQNASRKGALTRQVLVTMLTAIFMVHVSYLVFWRFDYGYNMAFNVTVGLFHNLLWSSWSAYQYSSLSPPPSTSNSSRRLSSQFSSSAFRAPHFAQPFFVLTLFSSLSLLELLDFPPLFRSLDAHALWHASTIIIVKWWYQVLLVDAWWLAGRYEQGIEAPKDIKGLAKSERLA